MNKQEEPTLLQIIFSIIASFFGVQTRKNFERDEAYIEKHGLKPYIIIGFMLAILCVLFFIALVKIILYFAT